MAEERKENWGAWKRTTGSGEVINFTINDVKYSMWANSYKTEEKHPDFKIYVNEYVGTTEKSTELLTEVKTNLPF